MPSSMVDNEEVIILGICKKFFFLIFAVLSMDLTVDGRDHEGSLAGAETIFNSESTGLNYIEDWKALGPFLSAPQEGAIDHLYFFGGQEKAKADKRDYPSILAKAGKIRWFDVPAKSAQVKWSYPNLKWDFLKKIGGAPLTLNQCYLYAEVENGRDEVLLVDTKTVGEFFVNGKRFFGEPYKFGFNQVAVPFQKGKNQVLLKVSSYEDPEFEFSLVRPSGPIQILDDVTRPDLIETQLASGWLGVPMVNTTEGWLQDLRVKVIKDEIFDGIEDKISFPLAPLSTLKIPVRLKQRAPAHGNHSVSIEIYSGRKKISEKKINLRFRDRTHDEGVMETFVSKLDGSVQYYSLLYPKKFDPQKYYDAIVALHGANVEASLLTDNFAPKDWAFVVAPTNRRPHGFAYQDLGRLDALEVLDQVQKKHHINAQGLYLVGHSMGGEGTWHIGLHHPSKFQGLAPTAGWSSFQLYTPFLYQEAELRTPPQIRAFRDRVIMDSNNPYFVENAKQLPVYISNAERDDDVPAFHSRLMNRLALNAGAKTEYREVNTDVHWFIEPLNEGRGYDSMDHPEGYEFLKAHPPDLYPKQISFKLFDLGIEKDFYWTRVEEQHEVFTETKVHAMITDAEIKLRTSNVKTITLNLAKQLVPNILAQIQWNNKKINTKIPSSRRITLELGPSGIKRTTANPSKKLERHSLKTAFFSPYLIVYGTNGSPDETEVLLHNARLLADKAWRTANSLAPITRDIDVTPEMIKKYNLILFGSPERNSLAKKWAPKVPLKIEKGGIQFGKEKMGTDEGGLAYTFIFPNPDERERYIVNCGGTSIEAEKFANYFQPFYERLGYGVPDFLIFSKEVQRSGWGGVKAAGFFSKKWDLSNQDYVRK